MIEKEISLKPQEVLDLEEWLLVVAKERVAIRDLGITASTSHVALGYYGAEFDRGREGYFALARYSNKERRLGMDAVWGKQRIDAFNRWTTEWTIIYEATTGRVLPQLQKSGSKTSGMRQVLGELTAYSAYFLDGDTFQKRLSLRAENGAAYAEGRSRERAKMSVPGVEHPIKIASIPPGYIAGLIDWLNKTRT